MAKEGEKITYSFEVDEELWEEWKMTVPRTKSLEDRLIELIEEDKRE